MKPAPLEEILAHAGTAGEKMSKIIEGVLEKI
jgi:hypothetical protein